MTVPLFWFLLLSLIAFAVIASVQTMRAAHFRRDASDWRQLAEAYRAARNAERVIR